MALQEHKVAVISETAGLDTLPIIHNGELSKLPVVTSSETLTAALRERTFVGVLHALRDIHIVPDIPGRIISDTSAVHHMDTSTYIDVGIAQIREQGTVSFDDQTLFSNWEYENKDDGFTPEELMHLSFVVTPVKAHQYYRNGEEHPFHHIDPHNGLSYAIVIPGPVLLQEMTEESVQITKGRISQFVVEHLRASTPSAGVVEEFFTGISPN